MADDRYRGRGGDHTYGVVLVTAWNPRRRHFGNVRGRSQEAAQQCEEPRIVQAADLLKSANHGNCVRDGPGMATKRVGTVAGQAIREERWAAAYLASAASDLLDPGCRSGSARNGDLTAPGNMG